MKRAALFLALTMAVLLPQAAPAQDTNDKSDKTREAAFDKRVFGGPIGNKAVACFARRYDTSHLAQHPKQKVSSMNLLVTASLNCSRRGICTCGPEGSSLPTAQSQNCAGTADKDGGSS